MENLKFERERNFSDKPSRRSAPRGTEGGRRHVGLGREMMMHAGTFDADLGRQLAEAEAMIPGFAHPDLGQVHQALSGFTHFSVSFFLSIDRCLYAT